jgi:hypothetical protein
VVLLQAEIMFFDLQSQSHVFVFCQESDPSSIPGQMSYVDRGDPEVIRRMLPNNAAHDLDTPVFAWSGVVAVETRTWSGVKSLYAD